MQFLPELSCVTDVTDHPDDYLCVLYPWWIIADSCAELACDNFSLESVLEQCKKWVSLPSDTDEIRMSKGSERIAFMDTFAQESKLRRRRLVVKCSEKGCQYMSPGGGKHVLIHIPAKFTRLYDDGMIKRIKAEMVSRHKTSVKKLLALDHICASDLIGEVPMGCCIPDARPPHCLIPLAEYEGNNKVKLMQDFLNGLSSIKKSLAPIPQSPHSDSYVRKLTPAAVPVKRRSNRIRARVKKARLNFPNHASM